MMKKILSLLFVAVLLVGMMSFAAIGADAADAAQTVVDVKSGDKVTYTLKLGDVPEKIIGCDFSVYYDADVFDLDSVADFTNTTDDWSATINPNIPGEVRGNWSILNGVDFSKTRNFVTLNLTAKAEKTAHLSYYIRFMYDNSVFDDESRPQITDYTFTCSVTVNSQAVVENAQPELNVDTKQNVGSFVNSVNGKGDDADVNVVEGNNGNSGNSGSSDNSGNNGNSGNSGSNSDNSNTGSDATTAPQASSASPAATENNAQASAAAETKSEMTQASEGSAATTAAETTAPSAPAQKKSSIWLWIIIGLIVLLAGGGIGFFVNKNKKKA